MNKLCIWTYDTNINDLLYLSMTPFSFMILYKHVSVVIRYYKVQKRFWFNEENKTKSKIKLEKSFQFVRRCSAAFNDRRPESGSVFQ